MRGKEKVREEEKEEEEEAERQRELKLGTKVLTFVPSKVFRIMVAARRGGHGRKR